MSLENWDAITKEHQMVFQRCLALSDKPSLCDGKSIISNIVLCEHRLQTDVGRGFIKSPWSPRQFYFSTIHISKLSPMSLTDTADKFPSHLWRNGPKLCRSRHFTSPTSWLFEANESFENVSWERLSWRCHSADWRGGLFVIGAARTTSSEDNCLNCGVSCLP